MRGNKLWKYLDAVAGTLLVLLLRILLGQKHRTPPVQPVKILVIKLAAMGDTVLLIPSLRALRKQFPSSVIWMIDTAINEEVVAMVPQYVDVPMRFEIGKAMRDPLYFIRFIRHLRKQQFQVVVDFEQWSFVTAIISALSGATFSIGFKIPGKLRHLLYSQSYVRSQQHHEAQNMADLMIPLGIGHVDLVLELPVALPAVEMIQRQLDDHGWKLSQTIVVVHPGCGSHGFPREWPLDSYRLLCQSLHNEVHPFFIFTGSGPEEELTFALSQNCSYQSMRWNGRSLSHLIALLSLADLVISGNNGVMHLAAALQRPQIALHGPTNAVKWGPINPYAVVIQSSCPGCPCLDLGYEYHRTDGYCMAQITVEEVIAAARCILRY